ncbi:MAG: hypothetical protein WCA77_09015, partial [Thermoplasmata archaeon]
MAATILRVIPEHLTPHDLVTYSRCPHEMELTHRHAAVVRPGDPAVEPEERDKRPGHHSLLFPPPLNHVTVFEGRLDLRPTDVLVYADEGEHGLPVMFAPEQIRTDPAFTVHGANLFDDELRLSGRPDFIVRRSALEVFPIEYKATHLFPGIRGFHGRTFDIIQVIVECRLVHAASGVRPYRGVLLYGDAAGSGDHEGWMEVEYGPAEENWLHYALQTIRSDEERAPIPSVNNCLNCSPNRLNLCHYATC